MSNDAERITILEEHVAEQGKQIDELNQVITDQWSTIEKLKRDIKRLTDEWIEFSEDPERGHVTKPPHY